MAGVFVATIFESQVNVIASQFQLILIYHQWRSKVTQKYSREDVIIC